MFVPSYIKLHEINELRKRVEKAYEILKGCKICPRQCGVNRLAGEKGVCQVGKLPMVSSYHPHFGEERPLVGRHGSGTIFLTFCNLLCVYCQNYEISHLGEGSEVSIDELTKMMLYLQKIGCHNINFVTPTHVVPQILAALPHAIEGGLSVSLVYNSGGYERVETLKLLDGVFDIYMPDFKYAHPAVAKRFSKARDYPEVAKAALREMHRQVGDLVLDEDGIAQRGLLVRHLVLPDGLAGTREIMRFLAQEISPNTYVNVMDQYRPCGQAHKYPPLNRPITLKEFQDAVNEAFEASLRRLDGITV